MLAASLYIRMASKVECMSDLWKGRMLLGQADSSPDSLKEFVSLLGNVALESSDHFFVTDKICSFRIKDIEDQIALTICNVNF